ncbi:MAG TPA: thiamine biosynthesis protein, partial [Actinobacteria bacterium]|nr:thiamine biosynthesis protein [Actinomycetota bacterium]
ASLATDGLIDCTVGQQLVHWGYRSEVPRNSTVVVSPEVFTFRPATSWRDIEINESTRTVRVPSGTLLDFGATAKAWASDVAADRIAQSFGVDVVVGIGGDLAIRCTTTDQLSVEVGEVPEGTADVLLVGTGGVATSTTVRRQWMTDHGMAHHIVDPRTGHPARSPWRTVSVIAANCQAANHAATAALAMGADAPQWLSDLGLSARLVSSAGERHWVGSWGDSQRDAQEGSR